MINRRNVFAFCTLFALWLGTTALTSVGAISTLAPSVTILADTAELDVAIDLERAEEAMRRASERVENRQSEVDLSRALQAFRRAQIRVSLARRRGRRSSTATPPVPTQRT